jgi:hypothetical protein
VRQHPGVHDRRRDRAVGAERAHRDEPAVAGDEPPEVLDISHELYSTAITSMPRAFPDAGREQVNHLGDAGRAGRAEVRPAFGRVEACPGRRIIRDPGSKVPLEGNAVWPAAWRADISGKSRSASAFEGCRPSFRKMLDS